MLRTSVAGKPAVFPKELAELGNRPVAGAFVSLKRSRHLRSCCGLFGATLPLGQALEQATVRAAWEDPRFPPLSPTELDRLNMEVWLLYAPELVKHRGEQRLQAITLGTHGIQVVRDQARGLFLPSVPVEAGWDVLQYLEQVCLKAGLPPHSWKEDETALYRFEGVSLRTPLADIPGTVPVANRAWPCRPEDLLVYQEWCRSNLMALALGATPSYYCPQVSDGSLTGLILQLPSAGRGGRTFGQFSLRPPLPLQATLFSLVQSAAQYLAGQGGKTGSPSAQPLRLTFLQDPVLQGSVADPHLEGLNPKQRGLLVLENDRLALVFDPGRSPEELLAEATNQVRVRRPAAASLFSLEVLGAGPVSFSTVPRPDPGAGIRPPAVAGRFYSADAADLTRTVESLLNGERRPEPWPAALVPHAGLAFSGRVAGEVFRRLLLPPQIIVIGPKHTRPGLDWAVAPHQSWGLPGRTLEADPQLARQLCQAIPGLEMDAAAHQHEHSIEVQLPFLAHLAPKIRVVGIVVGPSDLDHCCRFAQGLAGLLRNLPQPPLLLISSDLNHFAPDPENRRLDALALKALQKGDPKELFQTVTQHHISMCGLLPAVIVLETLRLLGRLQRIEQVAYATSGEATGDLQRVVGYGGMLFGPGMGN
jgi:AmmeMemoRadiSam system protein B/AmmeMemoRadiSam system protein A